MTAVLKSIGLKPLQAIERLEVAFEGLRWAVTFENKIFASFAHRHDADEYANYRNKDCDVAKFYVREIA